MKLSVEQISRENEEEVIISRHIMLSTFFMCLLFNPASQLPVVSFFGRCILFTLVCMATLVVYYSRTELTLRAGGFAQSCMRLFWKRFCCPLHTIGNFGTDHWMPSFMPALFWRRKSSGIWSISVRASEPPPRSMNSFSDARMVRNREESE